MTKIVTTISTPKKLSRSTAAWSNPAKAATSNARFAGMLPRQGLTLCSTRASAMDQSAIFTTNASSSGSSRRWRSRKRQRMSATCGSNSSARFARHPIPMSSNPTVTGSVWLMLTFLRTKTSCGSSPWHLKRTQAAWFMSSCPTKTTTSSKWAEATKVSFESVTFQSADATPSSNTMHRELTITT